MYIFEIKTITKANNGHRNYQITNYTISKKNARKKINKHEIKSN